MKPIQFIFKCSIFCILLVCSATAHAQKPVPNAYIHLKGTLGEQPITMDLLKTKRANSEYYQGTYYYDKYQVPIGLYDMESATKNLLVFEEANSGMDQNESAKITGKLTDKGFGGEWKKGKKTYKVTLLIEQNKDLPSFDYVYFEDSIKFQPKKTETPRCDVSLQLLMPNKSVNATQKTFIEQEIYKMLLDDSLVNYLKPKSPADIFKVIKQQNFDDFKEFIKDFKPNEAIENPMSFSIEDHKSLNIPYNENKRLCIESAFYYYSGGAHGMSSSAYNNLDLKTNKVVTLGDIFAKGFEKRLSAELEKSFRTTNGLKPKQALTGLLFENKIEHTDNFILTDKAIIFCYNPYEIAAYAFGQVMIPIQLANVKDILK